jgi:hypothetical protein
MVKKRFWCLPIACLLGLLALPGCNLFTDMHTDGADSNAAVLVADGKAALGRGDYSNAVIYFQRAVDYDPGNSDAREGLAEATVKAKHINLAGFIQTLVANSQNSNNGNNSPGPGMSNVPHLIKLSDWNCSTWDDLEQFFTNIINALDPIALGQTHGTYAANDPTINLNVGFIYLLRSAARVQAVTTASYQVVQISKNNMGTPADLVAYVSANLGITIQMNITQDQYNQLPDSFYWISPSPPVAIFSQIQTDVNTGLVRLQVAANTTTSKKMIDDITKMFSSLQVQLQ